MTLREALEASHALGARLDEPDFPAAQFEALQSFQRRRLKETYADFAGRERYREAVAFFLDELYGGHGFRERDRQVHHVLPIMERMLTGNVLASMAEAFELQAMSLELDIELAHQMRREGVDELTPARYAGIYGVVPRERREQQIDLICELGLDLGRLVRHRGLLFLLRAMRGPAHAAGFAELQNFLEQGFRAFRTMGDSRGFVAVIRERETAIMERLYAGHPEPFRLPNVQPK